MRFVRMKPGHGDVLLAEGDIDVAEDEQRLIEEFRRQLDEGMWAAVPTQAPGGRHEAEMVREFGDIPRAAEQVIFFPRAAGGAEIQPIGRGEIHEEIVGMLPVDERTPVQALPRLEELA